MSTGKMSKPREEGSITPSFPDGSITPSVPEVSPAVGQPRPHLTVAAGQKFDNVGQNFGFFFFKGPFLDPRRRL